MYQLQSKLGQAQGYRETLPGNIPLEMMIIPAGQFRMGSPDDELERDEDEGPVHKVTLKSFAMGRYPITQAQWRAVATNLTKIERDLNPGPSRFKETAEPMRFRSDDRPVENVNWYEAVEFCNRLSAHTKRDYRLPSEAQWEYACRAKTITPFHFGETLTTDIANYDGNYIYGDGVKGLHREETTPVGFLKSANAFGLYDMHGNVWEWCEDHYHSSYKGAPDDGTAWIDKNKSEDALRLLRGGSWYYGPRDCRSACRNYFAADTRYGNVGFRVVSVPART
jgi:formylglycine-generating enzyme required for sulfatase activity